MSSKVDQIISMIGVLDQSETINVAYEALNNLSEDSLMQLVSMLNPDEREALQALLS